MFVEIRYTTRDNLYKMLGYNEVIKVVSPPLKEENKKGKQEGSLFLGLI